MKATPTSKNTFNNTFKLHSEFAPAGDQPLAIEQLTKGVQDGLRHQTLLGVTGSGKTFTAANVIANIDVACRLARGSRRGWTTRWRHAEAPYGGAEGEALKG